MKIKISIVVIALFALACGNKEAEKESKTSAKTERMSGKSEVCNQAESMPTNVKNLNERARLSIDFSDHCKFQPIHVGMREGASSSEIVARFSADEVASKSSKRHYLLKKAEFMHFELGSKTNDVKVDEKHIKIKRKIDSLGNKTNIVYINLKLLPDPNPLPNGRDVEKKKVDATWKGESIMLVSGDIIDIHIENESEVYPSTKVMPVITYGKQCTSFVK